MKKLLLLTLILITIAGFAQPAKKPPPKSNSQTDMNKALEDAMQTEGLSEADKAAMRKMMGGMMPETTNKPGATTATFTDNKTLVPAKDLSRINSIPKKIFTEADVTANVSLLYGKLIAKISAEEKSIITKVMSTAKSGSALMSAAVTCLLQSHYQAAMGLAMKAVQADPKNALYQNNLAAILSQSGYPQNAVPYLNKLARQAPGNSTILHNLGYAWLCLGAVDSAKKYFAYSAARNTSNPETQICRGLINELSGDPKKASDNYVQSFEELPNPFTETMTKNAKAGDRLSKLDFEKLKDRIAIHEYFKKDWIKVPTLSDNVTGYENDISTKNGYGEMFDSLRQKIEMMSEASMEDLEKLAEKGEEAFIQAMAKETMKGVNMMSMPAVYVQKILQAHITQWTADYARESQQLKEEMRAKKASMTKAGNNDKCEDYDRKHNAFMQYANPLIRKFHAQKIEEFRTWLNAFCTWSWYITGNPKNVVLAQCITWTSGLADIYESAVSEQYAFPRTCVQQNSDRTTFIATPAIPNFTCPAVVSLPVGLNEIRLSAEAINFNDNSWKISQVSGAAMPNVTLSFGVSKADITEPGKYGNPYAKTGNGSVNVSGINYGDSDADALTPLKKIVDDLTALTKIPMDELTPLDPQLLSSGKKLTAQDAVSIRRAELARRMLSEMMSTKCPGELPKKPAKFTVGFGKIEFEPTIEVWFGEVEFEKEFEVTFGEVQFEPLAQEVQTDGLQVTITNGLEKLSNSVKNFIKGLFE